MKAGDVLHLTRAASPQFVRPILFRLIKVRTELPTYDDRTWLDAYQLDSKGDAAAHGELFVRKAGVAWPQPSPTKSRA
ncbi:hypothetical protein ACGFIK_08795 [Micromonospora sp. NPDC048871]|uniref:hypothetical protein n=1 Tax=unclassified Micromonospora TaxID=2617518 RepID=UPI002E159C69|nr:hypothetical protein OIE53_01245 [Micromonospora sp. NBC_01739]